MGKSEKKEKKEKKHKHEHKHKKHKHEHKSHKSHKRHKSDRDENENVKWEGEVVPISADDWFIKSNEFRLWLREERGKNLFEMKTAEGRAIFEAEFVPQWNAGKESHGRCCQFAPSPPIPPPPCMLKQPSMWKGEAPC